jgi:spore coat protein A
MDSFMQQILPPTINPATGVNYPMTRVWGYGGQTDVGPIYNSPGPSFEAVRGTAIDVKYVNNVGMG